MEANTSRQQKDEKVGSLKKTKGRKAKAPMKDLDADAPRSYDDAYESPRIHHANKRRCLAKGSDNQHYSKANLKHRGHKRCKTVTPRDTKVSVRDDFFDDVKSCLTKLANLDKVIFLFFIISSSLNFPFLSMRQYYVCFISNPSPLCLFLDW